MRHYDADPLLASLLPPSLARVLQAPDPPAHAVREGCHMLAKTLREMAAFVPSPVLDVHLAQPDHGWISGLNLRGTTLLISVGNFATLSSQLATRGREATEALGAEVARIAELVLHEVYARGGGLVKFGGEVVYGLLRPQPAQGRPRRPGLRRWPRALPPRRRAAPRRRRRAAALAACIGP